MKLTGPVDGNGQALNDVRFEALAAVPGPWEDAWEGRPIFVTTAGADYGPWVGSKDAGAFVRYGGGGSGYLEASLLCHMSPHIMFADATGFTPFDPVIFVTSRPLTVDENFYLKLGFGDKKKKKATACGAFAVILDDFEFCSELGWWAYVVFFNKPLPDIIDVYGVGMLMAKVCVWSDTENGWLDMMSVRVNLLMP
jgi:hypothetical protein